MKKLFGYVIIFSFLITAPVWATPTRLNNIPTVDVVPEKVLVFQYFGNIADDSKPDHFAGFKYGLMKNVEIGLDGRIFPEKSKEENLVLQGKVRFEHSCPQRRCLLQSLSGESFDYYVEKQRILRII